MRGPVISSVPGPNRMKALVCEGYGRPEKVLHFRDVEVPKPAEGQVLVKVHSASVNISDYYGMAGFSRIVGGGIRAPKEKRVGGDFAGRIESIGPGVVTFKPGDDVFGTCRGSFAEYAIAREARIAIKPPDLAFEEMAAVPVAGLTALQCIRDKGRVEPGQEVLVNGASGGVGTFAVQIAKALGAQVTGVCSTRNLDQARTIGATHVVDYTKEDFTRDGRDYDLICDIAGNRSASDYKRALKKGGTCLFVGIAGNPLLGLVRLTVEGKIGSLTGGKTLKFMGIAKIDPKDLAYVAGLIESGKVRSVIDRRYPLDDIVEALSYIGEKHTRGKVVIDVG